MTRILKIEAINKEEAREKISQKLEEDREDLSCSIEIEDLIENIKLVKEKRRFLGFGKKRKIYEVILKDKSKQEIDGDIKEEANLSETKINIDVDGEFQLKVTSEGIFIRILAPRGEGKPVRYQQIKQELDDKNIVEVDWSTVKEAVEKEEEKWVKVAPRKPELDKDAEVNINISGDKMKAFIDYFPALGGQKLSLKDLKRKLDEWGINYGIKEEKLTELINNKEEQHQELVAEGTPPVPGEDGRLIYHFEEKREATGTKKEDGSIDFYNLDLINNVKKGDVLVTRKEAQPGKPGTAVTGGEVLPPQPKTVKLPMGKNVIRKDENTLLAEIGGQVVKNDFKVSVLPVYEIDGDVDLSTGNIDFLGSVVVRGNVLEGFRIEADGNVEVKGNVSGAVIECEGEVVIHKGFIGKEKGKIEAKGDIKIKFVENGDIASNQSIYVNDAVMHSNLRAVENIEVKGRKGLIVGGNCRAGKKIEANIVGSNLATTTKLELGIDSDSRKSMQEIKEKIERDQKNLDKSNKALKLLNDMKEKKELPPEKKDMLGKLQKTKIRLQNSLEEYQKRFKKLKEKSRKLANSRIIVNKKLFPGTTLMINGFNYKVQDEIKRATFMLEEGEIRQIST